MLIVANKPFTMSVVMINVKMMSVVMINVKMMSVVIINVIMPLCWVSRCHIMVGYLVYQATKQNQTGPIQ